MKKKDIIICFIVGWFVVSALYYLFPSLFPYSFALGYRIWCSSMAFSLLVGMFVGLSFKIARFIINL